MAFWARFLLLGLSAVSIHADILSGTPDPAPPGYEEWISPIVVPAKTVSGDAPWASAVAKARAFVSQLTLDEKVNITTGAGNGRCVGVTGTIERLNFTFLCLEDSPVGVRYGDYASMFPAGINVAATWDSQMMYDRGYAIGAEHKGKGVNVALGPMTNMARMAASGRNWEGFGGDPYLSGVSTYQTVLGMQDAGVIATVKHFVGNEQQHLGGDGSDANMYSTNMDDRTLHEVYLWPFAEAVRAGVGSLMCSYNKMNQTQNCQNSKLLNGIVKEELDFQGFIMSDWTAIISGADSVLAGADMNMPGFMAYGDPVTDDPDTNVYSYWGAALIEMVNNGTVPESRVDDMVTRVLAAYYKLGQDVNYTPLNFDDSTEDTYVNGQLVNEHVNVMGTHGTLIRQIGAASAILLKNTGVLPLDVTKYNHYGIFGSDAGPNPDGPNGCSDRGCDQGTLAIGWGSGTANFPYLIDPLAAISSFVYNNKADTVIEGILDDFNYAAINSVAAQADVCLVFANADSGEGYITVDGNVGDRNNLTLWHGGEALINASTSFCSNTIVVLHTVGAVLMEDWIDNPNVTAVVYASLPGQETGNGLVDVLFGAVNPSGRLPYTIAKLRTDYAADVIYTSNLTEPQITYTEALELDYKWFDAQNITPRFEFGYGLSYTTFYYSGLSIWTSGSTRRQTSPGGPTSLYDTAFTVQYYVKNTGSRDGNEVSQLYLGFPESAGEPPKVLRGFERTFITAGETATVTLTLLTKDISIWDVISQGWIIPSGTFTAYIGSSSRNIQLTGTFSP